MEEKTYKGPPKTIAELIRRIDRYFDSRLEEDERTVKKQAVKPYTLTGFALALGLESREELYTFKDPKMQTLVRRGILKIEEYAEERLFSKDSFSGAKLFLAVNFDRWREAKGNVHECEEEPAELDGHMKKWAQ